METSLLPSGLTALRLASVSNVHDADLTHLTNLQWLDCGRSGNTVSDTLRAMVASRRPAVAAHAPEPRPPWDVSRDLFL
jgi:hypothetical protein